MSELPPLPETDLHLCFYDEGGIQETMSGMGYTAKQMQAYALEAVALAATTAPAPWATLRQVTVALAGLLEQVEKFTSEHGEADFETAEALRAVEAAIVFDEQMYPTPPSAVEAAQPEVAEWKRVPIDPTPDMRDAGGRATRSVYSGVWKEHRKPNEVMCAYIYRAMLAAAPTTEATSSPSDAERLDAARYRWLRDPDTEVSLVLDKRTGWVPPDDSVPGVGGHHIYEYRCGDELDAAIDAAIATKGGKL